MLKNPRNILIALVQIGFSLGLLAVLFSQLSFDDFRDAQSAIHARNLIIALVCFVLSYLLTSFNWFFLLRTLEVQVSYPKVLLTNLSGLFYGSVIPSSLSNDVARGLRLYQSEKKHAELTLSIVLDRLTGLIVFAIVLAIGVVMYVDRLPFEATDTTDGILFLMVGGIIGVIALLGAYRLFPSIFQPYVAALHRMRQRWYVIVISVGITLGVHLLVAGMLYVLALQFWESPDWFYCLFITEILTVAEFLPISVSGLGVREGLYVVMLEVVGIMQAEALAISLTQFFLILCVAALGGLYELYLFGSHRIAAQRDPVSPSHPNR